MNERLNSNNLDSIINRVCGDCWRAGAESNWIKLEWWAHTFSMGICDFCKKEKYITSVRNFWYPDFNLLKEKKWIDKKK